MTHHYFCCPSDPSSCRADPNRANVFCDKTPIEISMGGIIGQSYYGHNFEMLMLLAGFVKADTPGSVKLKILESILERYFDEGNYAEEFKTNLVGLSVSEVKKTSSFTRIIQFQ